jgi:hypothetical protein
MKEDLSLLLNNWQEEACFGDIILKHVSVFVRLSVCVCVCGVGLHWRHHSQACKSVCVCVERKLVFATSILNM